MEHMRKGRKMAERSLALARLAGDSSSWHDHHKGSAYIHIGGLHPGLTEGDVICVLSQFGEPVDIHLVRDHKTGVSRGFGFVAFEDQRSTNLAVDNLNGVELLGRTLSVSHANYQPRPKMEKGEDGRWRERDLTEEELAEEARKRKALSLHPEDIRDNIATLGLTLVRAPVSTSRILVEQAFTGGPASGAAPATTAEDDADVDPFAAGGTMDDISAQLDAEIAAIIQQTSQGPEEKRRKKRRTKTPSEPPASEIPAGDGHLPASGAESPTGRASRDRSRSPGRGDRSRSPDRRRARSVDRSPRRHSRSPSPLQPARGPVDADQEHGRGPGRDRGRDRDRSYSPPRQRWRSRSRSRSPGGRSDRAPDGHRRRSRSPPSYRDRSHSPDARRGRSPDARRGRSPDARRGRSPSRWQDHSRNDSRRY
ncbi:hypothetical protein H696_00436 [Fonticula alba]|uniref:RRM domain-containing protein n=1 Tax=Fonticula alba TaxID=691883 RepID=A0A058ZG11_FONAL|nr:hypothetical protein H696_00436 [Fonticula alba]KCV72863.1 hypothetical protein H696_00436 [Fonticula alba]|eukprot:XP_009492564.1 hypothetical protein H696_00436 [Fonticula alba]